MFAGHIVWKGIVYSILMIVAKLATGVWILLADVPFNAIKLSSKIGIGRDDGRDRKLSSKRSGQKGRNVGEDFPPAEPATSIHESFEVVDMEADDITPVQQLDPTGTDSSGLEAKELEASSQLSNKADANPDSRYPSPSPGQSQPQPPKPPLSIYPALILGLAMVARGEIAFLIASIASANGVFASSSTSTPTARAIQQRADNLEELETSGQNNNIENNNDDIFLIVIWAAVVCTIVGPLLVGIIVRRVKRLERQKEGFSESGRGVLGEWSVIINRNEEGDA
ncbi:hypothetical protein ABW20_dc0109899 [Dactylellina cionopaga]|nr:hypothetical protein ABW20_dc0109899 [Dactylellina cionopaga]